MAFSSKSKNISLMNSVKKYSLPVYIVISAAFILYVLWSYAIGVIYNSGVVVGQEQGYVAAFQQISQELTKGCEGVTLTLGEQEINVINTDCLTMQSSDMMLDESDIPNP